MNKYKILIKVVNSTVTHIKNYYTNVLFEFYKCLLRLSTLNLLLRK